MINLFLKFSFIALLLFSSSVSSSLIYLERPEVRAFIEQMVVQHKFREKDLKRWFAQVRHQASVIQAMSLPVDKPPVWHEYMPRFVNPGRINAGIKFWDSQQSVLAKVETEFGVPAEIIVAIIGIETSYGKIQGNYRVLDALTTLAFDYPRRAEYFRQELIEFLLLTRELGWSPLTPRGSYAGAMGIPQFMPTSYRNHAVDYDADGAIDLWKSTADAIASVARYLVSFGWQNGQSLLVPVNLETEQAIASPNPSSLERHSIAHWYKAGARLNGKLAIDDHEQVLLIMLEEQHGPTYWFGLNNFYVLTRYNRSRVYAAAVCRLAEAIREARVKR